MLKFRTYHENLRHAMNTAENQHGRPFTLREMANATQFSFEHLRKAYKGIDTPGEDANSVICTFLGLPEKEMWDLALQEKIAKKIGYRPLQLPDPEGAKLADLWRQLDDSGKATIIKIAESLAVAQHVAA